MTATTGRNLNWKVTFTDMTVVEVQAPNARQAVTNALNGRSRESVYMVTRADGKFILMGHWI